MEKISLLTVLVSGFYSQTPLQITKKTKPKAITEDKMGRKLKKGQKKKRQKAGNVNSGRQDEQWQQEGNLAGCCEISQVGKFRNLRNSTGCEIFATLQNSYGAPISLYFLLFFPYGF